MNKMVACASVVPGSLGASDLDGSRTNHKKRTAGSSHLFPEPSSKKVKKDEAGELLIMTHY